MKKAEQFYLQTQTEQIFGAVVDFYIMIMCIYYSTLLA